MSLIPDHSDHAAPEWPRAAQYWAILVLVVLTAIAITPIVESLVGSQSDRPIAPQRVRRPHSLPDAHPGGHYVFIADRRASVGSGEAT